MSFFFSYELKKNRMYSSICMDIYIHRKHVIVARMFAFPVLSQRFKFFSKFGQNNKTSVLSSDKYRKTQLGMLTPK